MVEFIYSDIYKEKGIESYSIFKYVCTAVGVDNIFYVRLYIFRYIVI